MSNHWIRTGLSIMHIVHVLQKPKRCDTGQTHPYIARPYVICLRLNCVLLGLASDSLTEYIKLLKLTNFTTNEVIKYAPALTAENRLYFSLLPTGCAFQNKQHPFQSLTVGLTIRLNHLQIASVTMEMPFQLCTRARRTFDDDENRTLWGNLPIYAWSHSLPDRFIPSWYLLRHVFDPFSNENKKFIAAWHLTPFNHFN